jgi:hypothetical protein
VILLGGPTREFLKNVWDQMGDLYVNDNGKKQRLFKVMGDAFVPAENSTIEHSDAAKIFYRAFGRILAYCILHQQKIAKHAMVSSFYHECTNKRDFHLLINFFCIASPIFTKTIY